MQFKTCYMFTLTKCRKNKGVEGKLESKTVCKINKFIKI